MEVGTLKELDVNPGDVVECVYQWYSETEPYEIGSYYTVNNYSEVNGEHKTGATGICAKWRIVSRASDTPKLWRHMTDEEKGALLLAHHEGKAIENKTSVCDWMECFPMWLDHELYRVKPEPVRETVKMFAHNSNIGWQCNPKSAVATHRITFETVDGKPDCSTIKMEELD